MTPEIERLAHELSEAREQWLALAYGKHFSEAAKNRAFACWALAREHYLNACEAHLWDGLRP